MGRKRVRTDSKFQSEKCAKRCLADDDRISRLPDDILVDILSFLPLKESARTSVLSFRWLNLWKHTSCLNFDAKTALDKITMDKRLRSAERRKYIKWVNDVLQSHEADTLRELRIHFDLNVSARKAINQWLAYAFSRQVERLELDLSSYNEVFSSRRPISYAFPEELLSGSTSPLQTHPKTCSIHHPLVDFKSLKALSLKCVDVTDDAIEFFLRNCPVLEQLIVHDSKEISNVEICGSSLVLKHLEISYCDNLKSIKVSAPNLTSLEVTIAEGLLLLENVPMLVEVSVTRWLGDLLPTLSCCISQLEILTLLLNEPKKSMVFPEMPKLKKLVIECGVSGDESLIGLTSLIRASPYLEEFVLKLHWFSLSSSDSEVKNTIRFPHRHLKVIKLSGYYGCGSDAELMKYFLENCVELEKVIIDNEDGTARNLMKQQLEAQVPPHIELVFV